MSTVFFNTGSSMARTTSVTSGPPSGGWLWPAAGGRHRPFHPYTSQQHIHSTVHTPISQRHTHRDPILTGQNPRCRRPSCTPHHISPSNLHPSPTATSAPYGDPPLALRGRPQSSCGNSKTAPLPGKTPGWGRRPCGVGYCWVSFGGLAT